MKVWTGVLAGLWMVGPCLGGCGGDDDEGAADGDADADADADSDADADGDADAACRLPEDARTVELDLLVDGNPILTCTDYWRLNVRVCGAAEDPACDAGAATCGSCDLDMPTTCRLGDACLEPTVELPTAGTYMICVEAELINGGLNHEQCAEVTVGAEGVTEPLAMDIETDNVFPCVRDWTYDPDENMCCDYAVGYCAPPGYNG